MKTKSSAALLLAGALLFLFSACGREQDHPIARYQFVSNDGIIYRGDTISGEVARYDQATAAWIIVTGQDAKSH